MKVTGDNDLIDMLAALEGEAEGIVKQAVYFGADIIADEMRKRYKDAPEDERYVHGDDRLHGIKKMQKQGLLDSLSIAPMRNEGDQINTIIGVSGYNNVKTRKYPNGQPNNMIARSLESGSSIMDKHPVVRPTLNATRSKVKAKVEEVIKALIAERQK